MREPAEASNRKKETDSQILYVFKYQRQIHMSLMFIEHKGKIVNIFRQWVTIKSGLADLKKTKQIF